MTYGLTADGFEAKPLDVIREEMNEAVIAGVSPNYIVTDRTPGGQKLGAVATQVRQVWEATQALWAARDVTQATGEALDQLLTPVIGPRDVATFATVNMTVTLAAGTYPAGSLIVHASGLSNIRFLNDSEIVTAGATLTGQAFTCEVEGEEGYANINTLTQIASNPGGFSAPNNPAAATPGREAETDYEYRTRWLQSLSTFGSTTVDAIRAELLNPESTPNVTSAKVYGNETGTTDANGVEPYSIMPVVVGGTDAAVAETIFRTKAAPTATTGSTSVTVVDSQGQNHVIKFVRPTEVRLYCAATVTVLTGVYPASAFRTVEIAIHNSAMLAQTPDLTIVDTESTGGVWPVGEDILINKVRAAIMRMPGVVDVTALTIDTVSPPVGTSNIAISISQYGDVDLADVTVTLNYVSAVP